MVQTSGSLATESQDEGSVTLYHEVTVERALKAMGQEVAITDATRP